jgi:ectoine hydroxylase-related dioxygenase (phytanoyl-CoA dioxygenase family)
MGRQAVDKALLHGATVLPDILTLPAAFNLRAYVLRRNRQLSTHESIDVIMSDHRSSFALSAVEHESVTIALQQVGRNRVVRDTLTALLGSDPALVELQVITARAGADYQYWHADTIPTGSAVRYQHSFVPMYTLLIQLQDTDADMGPTAVCPGSHRCFYTAACSGFGLDSVNASSLSHDGPAGFSVATDVETGVWKAGHGLLFTSALQHRGSRHVQGPDRVALILSFASPPDHDSGSSHNSRLPPLESVYAIRWDQLGYTLQDLRDPAMHMQFWNLRWTGLLPNEQRSNGWNSFRLDTFRTANDGQYRFGKVDLQKQVKTVQGLLGSLSVLFGVDVQDAATGYQPVEYHAMRLLRRIRTVSSTVAAFFIVVYVTFVAAMVKTSKVDTWIRLLVYVAIAFAFWEWYIGAVELTAWAQNIAVARIATVPDDISPYAPCLFNQTEYSYSITAPVAQDILVAASLSTNATKRLAAQAYFLDYHPGNRRWRLAASEWVPYFFRYKGLPSVFQQAVVDGVIDATRTPDWNRFLRRNEFGDWLEMDGHDIQEATVSLLWEIGLSRNQLSLVFPKTPCDGSPGSPLCRIRPPLFSLIDPRKTRDEKSNTVQNPSNSIARIVRLAATRSHRSKRCHATRNVSKEHFNVGQVVEYRPGYGASRKWVRAKVLKRLNEWYYDIEYLEVNSPVDGGVHREYLRSVQTSWPGQPIVVGRSIVSILSQRAAESVTDMRLISRGAYLGTSPCL